MAAKQRRGFNIVRTSKEEIANDSRGLASKL